MTQNLFTPGMAILRIYTAEKDHCEGIPFYEWLAGKACSSGMAGATVIKGVGGYCLGNPVLAPQYHHFQINQPVIVEIIDKETDIERFIQEIDHTVPRGLMTIQPVRIRYYGHKKERRS